MRAHSPFSVAVWFACGLVGGSVASLCHGTPIEFVAASRVALVLGLVWLAFLIGTYFGRTVEREERAEAHLGVGDFRLGRCEDCGCHEDEPYSASAPDACPCRCHLPLPEPLY